MLQGRYVAHDYIGGNDKHKVKQPEITANRSVAVLAQRSTLIGKPSDNNSRFCDTKKKLLISLPLDFWIHGFKTV